MKTPHWLLLFAVVQLGLIGYALLSYNSDESTPAVHPLFATMEVGGQRASDDAAHWYLGLALGLMIIGLLTASLTIASNESPDGNVLRRWILASGVIFGGVYLMMMLAYRNYAAQESSALWGPFPVSTTWMVFGVWFTPLVFVAIYYLGFNRWFVTADNPAPDEAAS